MKRHMHYVEVTKRFLTGTTTHKYTLKVYHNEEVKVAALYLKLFACTFQYIAAKL